MVQILHHLKFLLLHSQAIDPRISYPAYAGMYDQYGIDKILLAQPMSFGAMPLYTGQHPLLKTDSDGKLFV